MKAPRNADWEAQVRESFKRQGFMRLIGAEIVALAPGRCSIVLPASEHVTQQRGFLHGGVTAAIADTAAGFAAYSLMPANSSPLTVEYKINLMAPGVGERFVAAAEVVRSGRTLTVVECAVSAEAGGRTVEMARMLATLICLQDTPDVPPARGAAAT